MTRRFRQHGLEVFLEESHELPLVDLVIRVAGGSLSDPDDLGGLTRVMGRLYRRGTRRMDGAAVDAAVAALGARLAVSIGREALTIHGSVLARNVEPFVALVAELLRAPAFRQRDLARAKRRIKANLVALRDDDYALASRHLRALVFGEHPYGRPPGGTHASIGRITRADLLAHHARTWRAAHVSVGAAGAIDEGDFRALLARHFADVPRGPKTLPRVGAPKLDRGRRLLVVHKPDRTQTQLGVGTLGIKATDRLYFPFLVADAAFGGMFTSRLMQAVRAERGWSYSAYSAVGIARHRDMWRMWTHPSVDRARDCLALQLELLEAWASDGLRADEVRRAKRYLVGSRCFEEDTAYRRLELAMAVSSLGQSDAHLGGYAKSIRAVDRAAASEAVRRRVRPRDLAIVAVGDAGTLADALGSLPGVVQTQVVPFDARL